MFQGPLGLLLSFYTSSHQSAEVLRSFPPTYKPAEMAHSLVSHPLHASALCPVRIILAVAPCKLQGQNVATAHVASSHFPGKPQSNNALDHFPVPTKQGTVSPGRAPPNGGPPA